MGNILLCAFLILYGLTLIAAGLSIPMWVPGLLAIGAGMLLLMGR